MSAKTVKRWISELFSQIPIFGYLTSCGYAQHKAALRDFMISVLFSTATFWLSAFFLWVLRSNAGSTYLAILRTTVQSGELFIFTVGFLGPILLVAIDDPPNGKPFPGKLWHMVVLILLMLVSVGFFALTKISHSPSVLLQLNMNLVFTVSLYTAGGACLLRYLAMVYRKQTIDPEAQMKIPEREFARQFAEHRASGREEQ